MIAGGNPPDVSRVAVEGARLVVSRGLVHPLDDFMKGDADIDEFMKNVSPRLLEVFRVDGKTYEFPFDWNNMVSPARGAGSTARPRPARSSTGTSRARSTSSEGLRRGVCPLAL